MNITVTNTTVFSFEVTSLEDILERGSWNATLQSSIPAKSAVTYSCGGVSIQLICQCHLA